MEDRYVFDVHENGIRQGMYLHVEVQTLGSAFEVAKNISKLVAAMSVSRTHSKIAEA